MRFEIGTSAEITPPLLTTFYPCPPKWNTCCCLRMFMLRLKSVSRKPIYITVGMCATQGCAGFSNIQSFSVVFPFSWPRLGGFDQHPLGDHPMCAVAPQGHQQLAG